MNKDISIDLNLVNSDEFLDMPRDVQLLYYNMLVNQNEDGVVYNAKAIQRALCISETCIKILVAKNFVKEKEDEQYEVFTHQ